MLFQKKISVSIPVYNEEDFIVQTINGIPKYVDHIIIYDDCSTDNTVNVIKGFLKKDNRIILIENKVNKGKGAGLIASHQRGVKEKVDIIVSIDGDNQMDCTYMQSLIEVIIVNDVDYVKGNRFFHLSELSQMPKIRLLGNAVVSILTKLSTGYWSISDPLNGYTAIKSTIYSKIDNIKFTHGFDIEIAILNELSLINAKVKDVFIPAKYGNEVSDIRIVSDTLRTLKSLFKGFIRRMFIKFILLNFSPIALFYISGFILLLWGILFGIYVAIISFGEASTTSATVMISVVPFILGFQLLLQAITLDINSEPK